MSAIPPALPSMPSPDSGGDKISMTAIFSGLQSSFYAETQKGVPMTQALDSEVAALGNLVNASGNQQLANTYNSSFLPAYNAFRNDPNQTTFNQYLSPVFTEMEGSGASISPKALNNFINQTLSTAANDVFSGNDQGAYGALLVAQNVIDQSGAYSTATCGDINQIVNNDFAPLRAGGGVNEQQALGDINTLIYQFPLQ